jgi:hypothetical protein
MRYGPANPEGSFKMRQYVLAAVSFAALTVPALAQDRAPALDLVARFVLGIEEGATLGMAADNPAGSVATKSAPGKYAIDLGNGTIIGFDVSEKANCVFDIGFTQNGSFGGGIEVNAALLKAVTYESKQAGDKVNQYAITLEGAEGVVQYLGPNGELSPAAPSSILNTSLTDAQMQESVGQFQSSFCPAAA